MRKRVMVVYGTRPEAVKMAPLIKALQASDVLEPVIVSTGQHRQMLDQVNNWFGISPGEDLEVLEPGSTLNALSARVFGRLDPVLDREKPDAVVVQGDTTTVAIASLACFYRLVPVVHLEAGLRSGDMHSPFPEEANRRIAGLVSALHLAPTPQARDNLIREGVNLKNVVVAGNTVIDALRWTADQEVDFGDRALALKLGSNSRLILLTTHRRENWGEPMRRIGEAVAKLAVKYPDVVIVFPAHANPLVREQIEPSVCGFPNVIVCEPLAYQEFVHVLKRSTLVLTDSGGVQEEAPSLGTPVLVLRENTERPEAVEAGVAKLIGTTVDRIVNEVSHLLDDADALAGMAQATNPYGDGRAAERSVAAIAELLGVGQRLPDFTPGLI